MVGSVTSARSRASTKSGRRIRAPSSRRRKELESISWASREPPVRRALYDPQSDSRGADLGAYGPHVEYSLSMAASRPP